MKDVKYTCLFSDTSRVPRQYPWMAEDEACAVAVIGGGVTGCCAAYQLAKAEIDTVLVTRKPVGFSSLLTHMSALGGWNELLLTRLTRRFGKENAVLCLELCAKTLEQVEEFARDSGDFAFRRRDAFLYTSKPEQAGELNAEYLMRKHNGFPVHFLDQSDAREAFSFPVKAGILAEGMGGEVDGYRFCHALALGAREKGARIYENTGVVSVGSTAGGMLLLTDNGRRLRAEKVVLAVGSKQDDYLPSLISKRRSFTLASTPAGTALAGRFPGYESQALVRDMGSNISMRTTQEGRVLINGLDSALVPPEGKLGRLLRPERAAERKYAELWRALEERLVAVGGLEPEYCCNGVYGVTRDGLPLVGEHIDFENLFFDLPSSPNGILFSFLAGRILADLYRGNLGDNLFSPNRITL